MKKYFTWRIWILIFAFVSGIIVLSPSPWATGVEVISVEQGSDAALFGLNEGQKILSFNDKEVLTVADVMERLDELAYSEQEVSVRTSSEEVTYTITNDLGFLVDENLTLFESSVNVTEGSILVSINEEEISSLEEFEAMYDALVPKKIIKIDTTGGLVSYASRETLEIVVDEARKTRLHFGLDFMGGTRVLLRPVSSSEISDDDIQTLIDVLGTRLNVYGLSDIKLRSASDWEGNRYVLVELAGVTEEEVRTLVAQQGKFEAKVANITVFEGGKEDLPYVCRNDGSCSGVQSCTPTGSVWTCQFSFTVTLSQEAAERMANATSDLDVVSGQGGDRYLSSQLELYLDGALAQTLLIAEELQGQAVTDVSISGAGYGTTDAAAVEEATLSMNSLQTILITGSLPFDLEIVKLDTVSPTLGEQFLKNILFVALLSVVAVGIVIFVRYRKLAFVLPVIITLLCELFLILSFAALVQWNLDIAAIAGILAAIGTGVDDQIVILDETVRGRNRQIHTKDRLKRAFFIIFAAYATTVAAMLPLWNAGAGLLRGFALTTIVGVTIGVFLTRPAFASFIEKFEE